ncbi:Putative outer membrane protein [Ignavibacterium album JCM 16511]|uniref:Putative outer membrane protein n=1 Tax=Ignavibacterium album (strain DSM 19864 / JCM 16511 / NBRC 101810 / Mat9-16) TaxID=945713 RepID=I0AM12_IGNAJ|nr:tail fiber domain-containing protein [Ignavibacterium album]AFH50019.1 Putative outer membrane protein [Ignavibacterium album JCM 16511]
MKSLTISLVLFVFFSTFSFAQNVEAKVGTNGSFTVFNSNNNSLLSVSETDQILNISNINLPNTVNQSSGIISKAGLRFLHTYGDNNVFLGYNSGNFTLSSSSNGNIAFGTNTLQGLTTGVENTAVGNASLSLVTTGNYNSAFGSFSLQPNTIGYNNSAFGYASLRSNTQGYGNTATGVAALYYNTTGHDNCAYGGSSLYQNTTGFFNSAFGMGSLKKNNGDENSAFGQSALFENTSGYSNSAFGTIALSGNTTGFFNTAIGYSAGSTVTTGSNLTLIGYNAQPSSQNSTNQITLGNNSITSLRCNVTSISSLSDARDKKNIKDLSLGLDFLMNVKPREFNWDKREWYESGVNDGSKMNEAPTAGFIAQELDEAQTKANAEWLNLVLKDNPEKLEATMGNLFPIVVKAVQDLKIEKDKEIASLKSENEQLRKELDALKEVQMRLAKLEQMMNSAEVKFSSYTGE